MQRRVEMALLGVLVLVLAFVYLRSRDAEPGLGGAQVSSYQFIPLNVQEPELRLDLLDIIKKSTYAGSHRNVFVFGPAPPPENDPRNPGGPHGNKHILIATPPKTPERPVDVGAQFFGSAVMQESGRRVAFFQKGEDVFVVAEGDTLLNNFRLIHVGNESADVLEISSGKHGSVPMVPPVTNPQAQPGGGAPPQPDADQ
jgi:hypothetical protein